MLLTWNSWMITISDKFSLPVARPFCQTHGLCFFALSCAFGQPTLCISYISIFIRCRVLFHSLRFRQCCKPEILLSFWHCRFLPWQIGIAYLLQFHLWHIRDMTLFNLCLRKWTECFYFGNWRQQMKAITQFCFGARCSWQLKSIFWKLDTTKKRVHPVSIPKKLLTEENS